jgi:valyl-tRNA synthetase
MISSIRNIRAEFNVTPTEEIDLRIKASDTTTDAQLRENEWIFRKLQNIGQFEVATELKKPATSASSVVDGNEIFVPLEGLIDLDKEQQRIEDEIERLQGFLKSVNKKLANQQFIDNAPEEVVQRERDKKTDTEMNLKKLQEILKELE